MTGKDDMWAYPFSKEEAEKAATEMELDKEYDYGMSEFPVMMKISKEKQYYL